MAWPLSKPRATTLLHGLSEGGRHRTEAELQAQAFKVNAGASWRNGRGLAARVAGR
jgi:hypothetical protein